MKCIMPRVIGIGRKHKRSGYCHSRKRYAKKNLPSFCTKEKLQPVEENNYKDNFLLSESKIDQLLCAADILENITRTCVTPTLTPMATPAQQCNSVALPTNFVSNISDSNGQVHKSVDLFVLRESASQYSDKYGWASTLKHDKSSSLTFSRIENTHGQTILSRTVEISCDLTWRVCIHGHPLEKKNSVVDNLSTTLDPSLLEILLIIVAESNVCIGNPDRFEGLFCKTSDCHSVFEGTSYYEEEGYPLKDNKTGTIYTRTIRAKKCSFLVKAGSTKCEACKKTRSVLRATESRKNRTRIAQKSARQDHSSKTPYKYLSPDELRARLYNAQLEKQKARVKLANIERKMNKMG